jgi:adenylate kinase family enzyme
MRVFVTGPTGSGKSTLSRQLSARYRIPFHSLDDIHWIHHPGGDKRRPMDEKLALLDQIAGTENWVIEGVQFKWADVALERADRIIVIDTSPFRTLFQIMTRFCRQKLGLESASYKPTLKTLFQMFRWSADYRSHERALLVEKLRSFQNKTTFAKDSRQGLAALGAGG